MIRISPAKYSTGPSPYKFVLLAIVSRFIFPLSCPFHITFFISPTIFTSFVVCCALVVQLVKVKIVSPKSVALKFIFIIYFLLFLCRSTMRHNLFISPTLWRISTQFWAALRHKRGVYFFPQDTVSCLQGVKGDR